MKVEILNVITSTEQILEKGESRSTLVLYSHWFKDSASVFKRSLDSHPSPYYIFHCSGGLLVRFV